MRPRHWPAPLLLAVILLAAAPASRAQLTPVDLPPAAKSGSADELITSLTTTLTASDAAENAFFGSSVAVSGNTAVVGAWNRNTSGAVYVFERNSGSADSWGQTAIITAVDLSDRFGISVAISGDTIVVGDDMNPGGVVGPYPGAAYIFERNSGGADNWGQVAKIVPADAADNDAFGIAVAISGDTVVVGSMRDDDNGTDSGSAYVFERNTGGADSWGQVAKIVAGDGTSFDDYGWTVAIDRDTIAVGARRADGSLGAAYLYERNSGGADSWGQSAKLSASDALSNERFGFSVAISGDTVAVGARLGRVGGAVTGAAYLFERNSGGADSWGEVAKLAPSDSDWWDDFGTAIALSCDSVVVSSRLDDDGGDGSGSAYVFERNSGGADAWGQSAKLTAPSAASYDWFGDCVAIDGNTVIVGGDGSDIAGFSAAGAAWVFSRSGVDWRQKAKQTASDGEPVDNFAEALAISGDTLLVGAEQAASGFYHPGAAYLFERNTGGADRWGEVVKITASDAGNLRRFGIAASLSGDTAVVGGSGTGISVPGGAYVFERNTGGADSWGEVTKLIPHDGSTDKEYGFAVGVNNDTAVVGAYFDSEAGWRAGAAYVFQRNVGGADNWGEVVKLFASDADEADYFGRAVAIHGDIIVVGAPGNDDAGISGSAYVFNRNAGGADSWGEVAKLTASDAWYGFWFGYEVAAYGDTVAVADPLNNRGVVYLFERNAGGADSWGQTNRILVTSPSATSRFGDGLSLSCDTLAVGAWASNIVGSNSGIAFVFARNQGGADNWGRVATLQPDDLAEGDYFGFAVGSSCNNVAIGAHMDDDAGSMSGSVYVYRLVGPEADLAITKDNGVTEVTPGLATTYSVTVSSAGPDAITGATVTDVFDPAAFDVAATSWVCAPDTGAGPGTFCPASGTATDLENGVSIDIESGDSLTFVITAPVLDTAAGTLANTATVAVPGFADDPDTANNSSTDTDTLRELDYGDADDPSYPTLLASAGARHGVTTLTLGYNVDGDSDGQPTATADGDDNDGSNDDDGVLFLSSLMPGETAAIQVWASENGVLDAWIDFNADGDWADPGEQVFTAQALPAGTNQLSFSVPAGAALGTTFARFRLSTAGGLAVTGVAGDGEVEDHAVEITTVAVEPLPVLTATATNAQVVLEWVNPHIGFAATMIRFRTDHHPTGPTDGTEIYNAATGGPGGTASHTHSSLTNGTTYYYAGFVHDGAGGYSTAAEVAARPQTTSDEVKWVYSTAASTLTPAAPLPGAAHYTVSNDRLLHAMAAGPSGGTWPGGWQPPAMNGPAQGRGPVITLTTTTINDASTVALVGSQDGHVYAFDASTGTRLWSSSALGGEVQAAPAAMFTDYGAPFSVVIAATRNVSGDSKVYGLDPADGSILWTFDNGGGASGIGVISSQPPIDRSGPDPRVYFASRRKAGGSSHTAWCLELTATPPTLLWSVDIGEVDGSPVLWGDTLYVGNNTGEVHALNPDTGAAVWPSPYSTSDGPVKSWVWADVANFRVIFSTTGKVHAVNDNGPLNPPTAFWSPALTIASPSCPLLINGTVYVGAGDDTLYAIDATAANPTPAPLELGDTSVNKTVGSPAFDVDSNHLVVGSDKGRVYAVQVPFGGSR